MGLLAMPGNRQLCLMSLCTLPRLHPPYHPANRLHFFRDGVSVTQTGLQWPNHSSLQLPTPASGSQVAGTTGSAHHTWLILFFVEMKS